MSQSIASLENCAKKLHLRPICANTCNTKNRQPDFSFPLYFFVNVLFIEQLIQKVFPQIVASYENHQWFNECTILAANKKKKKH